MWHSCRYVPPGSGRPRYPGRHPQPRRPAPTPKLPHPRDSDAVPWAQLAPLLLKIPSPALVRKPRPTYRNRPNGLRPDLVQKLQAMNPKIFRFPGGNHVEGVATQVAFGGRNAQAASIEVRADPDPQAGNTLASPDAVVPATARSAARPALHLPGPGQLPHRDAGGALAARPRMPGNGGPAPL